MSAAMSLPTNPVPTGDIRDKLIIGLDVPSVEEARAVVERIGDAGTFYKIGYQLAYAGGFEFARELIGQGKKVFLDLKLHDIGNTVEEGVRSVARLGATFLTVHAYPQTMRAAVAGKAGIVLEDPRRDGADLLRRQRPRRGGLCARFRRPSSSPAAPGRRATSASTASSAPRRKRSACAPSSGRDRLIVTPGIRPAGADAGDQKRIVTPAEGIRLGANHLVVGPAHREGRRSAGRRRRRSCARSPPHRVA